MGNFKSNSKLYNELSKPFESADEANESIREFFEGIAELRQKCKIPDVLVAVQVDVLYGEGEVGTAFTTMNLGDQTKAELLSAAAYGELAAERRALVNKLRYGKPVEMPEQGPATLDYFSTLFCAILYTEG